jgi:hypothetical protein
MIYRAPSACLEHSSWRLNRWSRFITDAERVCRTAEGVDSRRGASDTGIRIQYDSRSQRAAQTDLLPATARIDRLGYNWNIGYTQTQHARSWS